jgi:N-acetylglucosaminyldiphosphoundecaprenol N-acetyl-beta-D-mannosaminyltransferase
MHRHHLEYGVPVSIGIGGSFEFESGLVRRAPRIFQRCGFEWLWRLVAEPRRMYRRYLIEDPRFLAILWRQIRTRKTSLTAAPTPVSLTQQSPGAT